MSDALDQKAHPVVLARTSLSTTSQPGSVTVPMRLVRPAVNGELGPSAATPADVEDFLRIIWEASVVRSGGFFLRYQDADGNGLPDSIFSSAGNPPVDGIPSGDTAQLTIAVTFRRDSQFQRWHNAFEVALNKGYDKALYLSLADSAGVIADLSPSYPPGCVAFSAQSPPLDRLLRGASIDLYDANWVAHLYHLIQFRLSGRPAGSSPAFDASLWSLALTPQVVADAPGTSAYRQVVPAYRFVHGGGPSPNPYAAVGGKPVLTLRLNDVYGNALESSAHDAAFGVRYNDALMTPAQWPGVRIAYRFAQVREQVLKAAAALTLNLRFEPGEVIRAATPAMMVHGLGPGEATEDDHLRQQARVALQRYAVIIAQLADPRQPCR